MRHVARSIFFFLHRFLRRCGLFSSIVVHVHCSGSIALRLRTLVLLQVAVKSSQELSGLP